MTENEIEMLREREQETAFGERKPFESSRQATYEDSVPLNSESWDEDASS